MIGRGSWIRTNDLQYPKLPRYQAALYPDLKEDLVDTRLRTRQQGGRPMETAIGDLPEMTVRTTP
jgi:hypothetical protein